MSPPSPAQRWQSLTPPSSMDSRGKEFWLTFPGNYGYSTPTLTLFITGEQATTGTVEIPGIGFSRTFEVVPGQATPVTLPGTAQLTASDLVESKGIHVTAGEEIAVYGLNRVKASTDAFLGLPTDILGTDYLALGFKNTGVVNGTQFGLVATEDGTVITITPAAKAGTHEEAVPFSITLGRGQTYQLKSTQSDEADLSGSSIHSNRPIAVFGGHECANIPDGDTYACDHLVEQLPPTTTWGKSFATVPLKSRSNGDTFRFVAAKDGAEVSINGTRVATLGRGQVHQQIIQGMAHISSTQPILVAQYSNSSSYDGVTSDPFMMLIPPYEQFLARYTVTAPPSGFQYNFINVVVPASAVQGFQLDGTPVPEGEFTAIGASGFAGAQLTVSNGAHHLAADLPFGAFMYGFDDYDSYGYAGGMSLAPVAVAARLTVAPEDSSGPIHQEHCLTATLVDQNGQPVNGVRVDWAVEGVHTLAGFGNTDASGQNVFCYEGTLAGADTIAASVGSLSGTGARTWLAPEPTNRPPVALCQNLTLGGACGPVSGSVNQGSYDPDEGDTFSCVQTPSGPYTPGVHTVTLTCTDAAGLSASCQATITVERGTTLGETTLVLNGESHMQLQCGVDVWNDPGATATDMCGNPLAIRKFNSGDDDMDGIPGSQDPDDYGPGPNTSAEGTYSVQYMAIDSKWNVVSAIRQVTVDDTLPPTLTLNGPAEMTVACGNTFVDPSVTANDLCYGDLSAAVVKQGRVQPHTVGTYTLSYSVRDGSYNWATPLTRTVVVEDKQGPVVEPKPVTLWPATGELRTVLLSDCAKASDVCEYWADIQAQGTLTSITSDEPEDAAGDEDGNTKNDILLTGKASALIRAERNTSGNGRVYTLYFTVKDRAGNATRSSCKVQVPVSEQAPAEDDGLGGGYSVP
ncbi:immunoglobulin-like domain-containing protein [Stigmatella aurantiaca]|uniref:immunoglobulin-like domain-containing protein n=1 Tax=Stigmatella aurantiaca TaxID=41 RepID=UPI000673EEC9|nr:immunoglobulin-like domain-containing protein [Stigmatella aurantiaca]